VSSCTSTVYKPEVKKFSEGVGSASASFDKLVDARVEQDFRDRNTVLVDFKTRLLLSDSCDALKEHFSKQNQCLVSWSLHRQNPSSPKPTCNEPKPFAPLIPAGSSDCELGTFQGNTFRAFPTASVEDNKNHQRLADALAEYARQLGDIVSSKDSEELNNATVDAGKAVKSLQKKIVAANPPPKPPADSTAEPERPLDIGPIADLIGAGLRAGLEARRFQQLKRVAEKANPVVQQACARLSTYATQLYAINIVWPSLTAADNAALAAIPNPPTTFPALVETAALRKREYDALVAVEPSQVFKAVSDAHQELVHALNDPSRQYEALRTAVQELTEKVDALAAVLKKPEKPAS
jgi:hypothetical protein